MNDSSELMEEPVFASRRILLNFVLITMCSQFTFALLAMKGMVISTQEFMSKNKRTWFALKEFEIVGIKIWTGETLFSYYEDHKELFTAIKHHMMKGKLPKSWLRKNQDVLDPDYWLINSDLSK